MGKHVVRSLEINRGDHGHQILYFVGVQGGIAQGEGATLADAENVDLVDTVALAYGIHTTVQVAVDVVVQGEVAVGTVRITPVHQVDILASFHEGTDRGAVFLDIRHVGPVYQRVNNEQRHLVGDSALVGVFETVQG